jgi:hypothetical protein
MKLKKIKESYSDIDSSNAWDAYNLAIEYLGADELCTALAEAMGTDELASNLEYIFRMHEIPFGDDDEDEDEDFEESALRRKSSRRRMQEAGRMVNGRVSELSPQYDSSKSFYGKAKVVTDSDGTQILYSYDTPVVEIKDDKVVLKPMWDSSATTLRHVKEFLKQNGFEVGSKAQLAKMYGGANESLRRSNRIRSMKESQVKGNYMGIPDVKYVWHNTQSDPGIIYKDMYFNVYDIEDTLWNMFNDYCDETGVICDDDGFEQFVGENADTVYSILDDLIDNGYGEVIDTVPSVGPFKGGWRSNGDVIYGEGCGDKKKKTKKRKSMKESEGQDRASAYFDYQEYLDKFNAYCNQISNGELEIKGSVVKGDSFDEYILTVKDAYGSNEYVDIKLDYNWKDYANAWTATVDYESYTQDIYEDETSYSLDKLYKFVCDNLDLIVEDILG